MDKLNRVDDHVRIGTQAPGAPAAPATGGHAEARAAGHKPHERGSAAHPPHIGHAHPHPGGVHGKADDGFNPSHELDEGPDEVGGNHSPFFSHFLESQDAAQGNRHVTMAYPSDGDRDQPGAGADGPRQTMAYPSDHDKDDGNLRPIDGGRVTMAFPSDHDKDDGNSTPTRPGPMHPPDNRQTKRYPSDADVDAGPGGKHPL